MANLDEEDILPETVCVGEKKSDELYATITRLAEEKRLLFVENADLREEKTAFLAKIADLETTLDDIRERGRDI